MDLERLRGGGWTRRRFGIVSGGLLSAGLGLGGLREAAAKKRGHKHQHKHKTITRQLEEIGGSGVGGTVTLKEKKKGTAISVEATGLDEGVDYVSLYYDNDTCELEPYDEDDIVGGDNYTGDADGNGNTKGRAGDDLKDIGSVSVRLNSDFSLLACAVV